MAKQQAAAETATTPDEGALTAEAASIVTGTTDLANPPAVIEPEPEPTDPDAEPITDAEVLGSEADLPQVSTRDVVEWIRSKKPLPKFDPEDVARAIAWQIITAPSLEDALASGEMMQAQENLYTTLTISGVKWQPSDFDGQGSPVYAVLDIVDQVTGERRMMTCGGMNVVAAMVKADLAGEFPVRCRFTSVDTRAGQQTLKVELVRDDPNEGLPLDQQQF